MEIMVNGKQIEVIEQVCLAKFLAKRGFKQGKVIVEYNGEILAAQNWETVILSPNDRMEIVTFVGGG